VQNFISDVIFKIKFWLWNLKINFKNFALQYSFDSIMQVILYVVEKKMVDGMKQWGIQIIMQLPLTEALKWIYIDLSW